MEISRRELVAGSGLLALNTNLIERSCTPGQSPGEAAPHTRRKSARAVVNPGPTAPMLKVISPLGALPPKISFARPIDWIQGDLAVMQWARDVNFAKDVVTSRPVEIGAATNAYDFGLSALQNGIFFVRMHAKRGSGDGHSPNWSNVVQVGSAAPPVITSSATPTVPGFAPLAFALTADQPIRQWMVIGGGDQAFVDIVGSTLTLTAGETLNCFAKSRYAVTIRALAYSGLFSDQLMSIGVSLLPKMGS